MSNRVTITEKVKRHLQGLIERGELVAGSMLPSEREVAQSLGVARGTVRQAIGQMVTSGHLVSVARKATVVAGATRSCDPNLWALIVPEVDYFYPELIDAIEKEAAAAGKRILLACSRSDMEKEQQLINSHIALGISGILLAPVLAPRSGQPASAVVKRNYFATLPVPIVVCDHTGSDLPDADLVLSDNFSGMYDITTHLLRAGRRRLMAVRPRNESFVATERLSGFCAALADHECQEHTASPLKALDIMQERLDLLQQAVDSGVDGIVALNDHVALLLLKQLARLGVSVPSRVAVVGYDDEAAAALSDPPLTTVRVNKPRIARIAVQLLRKRCESGTEGRYRHVCIRPHVIVRGSCGGPKPNGENASNSMEIQTKQSLVSL